MKTKEQLIKEAYGEYFDKIKDYVDENGLLDKQVFSNHKGISYEDISNKIYFIHYGNFCRPKSLQGIEDNNGWIRIFSKCDLPATNKKSINENNHYHVIMKKDNSLFNESLKLNELHSFYDKNWITHYRLIEKPKKLPIF